MLLVCIDSAVLLKRVLPHLAEQFMRACCWRSQATLLAVQHVLITAQPGCATAPSMRCLHAHVSRRHTLCSFKQAASVQVQGNGERVMVVCKDIPGMETEALEFKATELAKHIPVGAHVKVRPLPV